MPVYLQCGQFYLPGTKMEFTGTILNMGDVWNHTKKSRSCKTGIMIRYK